MRCFGNRPSLGQKVELMVSVVYNGPSDGVALPDGREFLKGKPVEVDEDLAESLTRQGFKIVKNGKGAA